MPTPVDNDFVNWVNNLVNEHRDKLVETLFITDQELIRSIYDLTEVPDETNVGVNRVFRRKNSQVLAPFLLVLIPDEYDPKSNFTAGWLQSQIGLKAIDAGYSTGFCICVEHKKLNELMHEKKLWHPLFGKNNIKTHVSCTTVLFSVGKQNPAYSYNYSEVDKREITSIDKPNPPKNIKIVE